MRLRCGAARVLLRAASSAFAQTPPQCYVPVQGGFEIRNGKAEFTHVLYG